MTPTDLPGAAPAVHHAAILLPLMQKEGAEAQPPVGAKHDNLHCTLHVEGGGTTTLEAAAAGACNPICHAVRIKRGRALPSSRRPKVKTEEFKLQTTWRRDPAN